MPARSLLKFALSLSLVLGLDLPTSANAQAWPQKPVKIVVGFAPGGANDIVSRLLAEGLTAKFGQQFFVENKPGAAGRIAGASVAREPGDGHTFFMGAPGILVINPLIYKDVEYSSDDFVPVSLIGVLPYLLVVSPTLPAQSVQELVALLKAKPNAFNHGSTGAGPTLVQHLFKQTTGTTFENVEYKGTAPALADLMRGDIGFMFDLIPGHMAQMKSGTVRALAVSAPKRSSAFPELPTVAEAGVQGFDPTNWFGIVAPKAAPKAIVDTLSAALVDIVKSPEMQSKLKEMGAEPVGSSPEEFRQFLQAEKAVWESVIKKAGIEKQ